MSVAFVTGAGSGIGRATAVELARRGYAIGLMDLNGEALAKTEAEVTAQGARAHTFVGDVSVSEEVTRAVGEVSEGLGVPDAAAACAGVEVYGKIVEMDLDEWHRSMSVNLNGVMLTARAVLPGMIERGSGSFVAVASDAGVKAAVDWAPYNVAKHGVVGLVRSLAVDYGPSGVRSNVVCPSVTETPMVDRMFADGHDDRDAWASKVPLGRFATASEVANVLCHLLSDEASYSNGLVYMVDGGVTAGFGEGES